ncbi:MAG TPA: 4'-phosphopantetheinyl transferase superfamily protein [Opitutaceae bacterium]|jgi:4'-phosphopantetheinyl transferase|nr:4'-phosphopantetheinyl transferase superfamily protein [Opitutaceae bacterium]
MPIDSPSLWEPRAVPPELAEAEAHVWRTRVDWARWEWHLLPEERRRLQRFRLAEDSAREATGRGVLRFLLGGYLGLRPPEVPLAAGPHGKPVLGPAAPARLEFNLSHSGAWVLVALARGGRVGVDLERERPVDEARIAREFFHPEEVAEWERQAEADRLAAFFRLWTLKEAYLKALGTGLSKPPGSFRVTGCSRAADAALLWCVEDPEAPRRWQVQRLEIDVGYAAALATERPIGPVRAFTLLPS